MDRPSPREIRFGDYAAEWLATKADIGPQTLGNIRGRLRSMMEVGGKLVVGPTKTGRPRTLTLPRFLAEMRGEHIGRYGHLFPKARQAVADSLDETFRRAATSGEATSCDLRRR